MKELICCDQLSFHINEKEKIISYDPQIRQFSINVSDRVRQVIQFCPWCGNKLPFELSKELSKILFDEMDLDNYEDFRMPIEFKTDKWWKKRGL